MFPTLFDDYWTTRFVLLVFFAIVFVAIKSKNWLVGLAIVFPAFSATSVFLNSFDAALRYFSLSSLSWLLAILTIAYLAKDWTKYIAWFTVANSFLVMVQWILGKEHGGFGLNSSFNACLIAFCVPFIHRRLSWLWILPAALAVVLSETSAGYLTLLGVLICMLGAKYLLVMGIASIGLYFWDVNLFYNNGRFGLWHLCMDFWSHSVNHIIGTGYGTFPVLGQVLQNQSGYGLQYDHWAIKGYYVFMHSDWMQILFEQGAIGFLIFAVFACYMFWKFKPWRPFFAGFFLSMTVNSPLQIGTHQLIFWYVVFQCLKGEGNYEQRGKPETPAGSSFWDGETPRKKSFLRGGSVVRWQQA